MTIRFQIHPMQAASGAYDSAAMRHTRFCGDDATAAESAADALAVALVEYYGSQDAVADAYMAHWDLMQDGDSDAERGCDEWGAVWHGLTKNSPYSFAFEFLGL